MAIHTRSPGTGSITVSRYGTGYTAYAPQTRDSGRSRRGLRLGKFPTRRKAEEALTAYLLAQSEEVE